MDIRNPSFARHHLLQGKHNSFVVGKLYATVLVSRCFEDSFNESIEEIVEEVDNKYKISQGLNNTIHFIDWDENSFDSDYKKITFEKGIRQFKLYQRPKTVEELETRVKQKFKKNMYTWRKLDSNDAEDIIELVTQWRENKIEKETYWQRKREVSKSTQVLIPSSSQIQYNSEHPLTYMYGAFLDNQLVAFTQTTGNKHLHEMDQRAHIPTGMRSAQEYLDYHVFIELAKKGVPIIDRGTTSGHQGLLEYKRKFGDLTGRYEVTFENVHKREWRENTIDLPENKPL